MIAKMNSVYRGDEKSQVN